MSIIKELSFDLLIDKNKEKTYFEVPFAVPGNVSKIEVEYAYQRRETKEDEEGNIFNIEINVVDIAVRDESKTFRGWSGSERLYFYITENEATPGYISGIINEGEWAVILGVYKIQEEGCSVSINIKFTLKERILLKGDLHMHSEHSDGKYDVLNVINMAKLHGMDFVFLTDHNTFAQNGHIISNDSLVVMPGMEWTHYKGHCNFLGVKSPIKNFVANDKEKTVAIMQEAKESGAFITLNHPFCRNCGWKWGFDVPFDAVEIWNGPMKDSELDAVEWWHSKLIEGKKIPIVGGSDSHKNELFRMIGGPTTFVYCDSKGQSDIIKALKEGHSFVSYTANGPIVDFSIGSAIMGDEIEKFSEKVGSAKVYNVNLGDEIKLITDIGVEQIYIVSNEQAKAFKFDVDDRKFYRLEVWRRIISEDKLLVTIANPIYIRGNKYE